MKNRLKELMDIKGMTQKEATLTFKVSQTTISRWMRNNLELRKEHAMRIATHFNIDYRWLMGHNVPMELNRISRHRKVEVVPYIPPSRPKIRIDDSAIRRRPLPR